MLLKVAIEKDNATGAITWHNLYANSIRLRLRKDYNLLDIPDKEKARDNLGVTRAILEAKTEAINTAETYTDDRERWLDDRISIRAKFNLDNIQQLRKEFGVWIPNSQDNINAWNDITYEQVDLTTLDGVRKQGFTSNESIHLQPHSSSSNFTLNARNPNDTGIIKSENVAKRFWFDADQKSPSYEDGTNFTDYVYFALENAKTYIDDKNKAQDEEWNRRYNELKEWITNEINVLTNWMVARFADWQFAIGYTLKRDHNRMNTVLDEITTIYNERLTTVETDLSNISTDVASVNTRAGNIESELTALLRGAVRFLATAQDHADRDTTAKLRRLAYNVCWWIWNDVAPTIQRWTHQNDIRIEAVESFLQSVFLDGQLHFPEDTPPEKEVQESRELINGTSPYITIPVIKFESAEKIIWIG